ncbi:MAG: elongation factor G [Candidatus Omnitrophica bacterium]|nr:elongation factor G [Candidatus Omnitrophota bacterium]HOX54683.1 elongation factor G [Candidatus Omnitrophota bacterium]
MDAKLKRNFILMGHAQAGKTSFSESILNFCKASSRKGSVAEGNTVSDYSEDEIERKISISSSLLTFKYNNYQIQIIDSPGYADFVGEVISSARAVDSAAIVIDAVSGIEVGTEKAWEIADSLRLPRIFFINKIEKENASPDSIIAEIKDRFSKKAVLVESLDSSDLIEAVAETDDKLLEKYLESGSLSKEELLPALKNAIINCKVYPIIKGSAANDKGIQELMQVVLDYCPSPLERPTLKAKDSKTGEEKQVKISESSDFCAFVFKTIADPYVGQLTMIRIFSGMLASNTAFYNVSKSLKERIGQIYLVHGKEQRAVESANCGDIIALAKLKDTTTSDSLATEQNPILFDEIKFPEPAISSSVKPRSRQDEERISASLAKLTVEDPTFKVSRDIQTKEQIISGIGDVHLDVMIGRLKKRFNVEVDLGTPKVAYKETITKAARVQGKYKKQSGGRGQYGDVWIEIEPLPRGEEFEFVDKIFGGAIPRNYIPSVEKGVRKAMAEGAISGNPLVGVRVTLVDGSYHTVDSSDIAFQIAGRMALRKAVQEAGPVLLEPIMEVEVFVPDEFMGHITGDLNSRRGRIMGMDSKGKLQVVKATVPLSEMFSYASDLRSLTGGRGSYAMKFFAYEQVPQKIASTIIAQAQAAKKEEQEE